MSTFDGLFLPENVAGLKSLRLKYQAEGQEKLMVIGDCPAARLLQARQLRNAAGAELATGVEPKFLMIDVGKLHVAATTPDLTVADMQHMGSLVALKWREPHWFNRLLGAVPPPVWLHQKSNATCHSWRRMDGCRCPLHGMIRY